MTDRTTVTVTTTSGEALQLATDTGESYLVDDFLEYLAENTDSFIPLTLFKGHEVYVAIDKIERFESTAVPRHGSTNIGGKSYRGKYVDEEQS